MASFALYKASHPHFLTSSYHFYDITPTILDIVSTVSVSSHAHYWWYHTNWISEISSAIYDDIISIVYDITATECVSSHPHFQQYNTFCIQDITPTICIISYTPIKHHVHILWHHITFLWHHMYCIHDITSIISEMNSNIWHHTHGNANVISAIWPTVSNTTSTVSVSSYWGYHLYHTTLCMT